MSAHAERDPKVVTTADGTSWLRRAVTDAGHGLYAMAGSCCGCPEFLLVPLSELASLGIRGSADAMPMPVGSGPQTESLPLKVVVELNDLRTRLAGMANPPREVFLALYEGAEPELFTTVEAARECCDDLAKTDAGERYWDWTVNEFGVHIQFWTHADDDRPLSETSGSVTPIVVQGDDDLSELERLRARVAELEAEPAMVCRVCEAPVRWVETQLSEGGWWNHTAPAADGHGVTPKPAPGRVSYAEKAARESSPTRRAAWRMLAQAEESERVGEVLLAQPEESPAEAPAVTVFRASHDAIVMGLYTSREAAREHCQNLMERENSALTLEWRPDGPWREDDDGEPGPDEAEELYAYGTHESSTWDATGYVVTPLEVAAKFDEGADE